jgi:hypothetical protein
MTRSRFFPSYKWILFVCLYLALTSTCSSAPTPTPFRPPTAPAPLIEPTFIIKPTQLVVIIESSPLPTIIPTTNPQECDNNLSFVSDLTIPDGTSVTYGSSIDKQWTVENSGTCHWNSDYRLRHIGGALLEAPEEIALYPAALAHKPLSKSSSRPHLQMERTKAPGRHSTRTVCHLVTQST